MIIYQRRFLAFALLGLAALPLAAQPLAPPGGPLELVCEGDDGGSSGPVNYLRFQITVDDRVLGGRHMSLMRFKDGFESGEPHFIFEPVSRLGELWITHCNQPGWPDECTRQRPAQRDFMVSQMSEPGDPVFVSGYASCSFCPIAPFHIVTDDDNRVKFKYFEFDLVEGACRRP